MSLCWFTIRCQEYNGINQQQNISQLCGKVDQMKIINPGFLPVNNLYETALCNWGWWKMKCIFCFDFVGTLAAVQRALGLEGENDCSD